MKIVVTRLFSRGLENALCNLQRAYCYAVPPYFANLFLSWLAISRSYNADQTWKPTYRISYICTSCKSIRFYFQFSGSKATFHNAFFKRSFSRWTILSFKGVLCTPLSQHLFNMFYLIEFCKNCQAFSSPSSSSTMAAAAPATEDTTAMTVATMTSRTIIPIKIKILFPSSICSYHTFLYLSWI